MYKANQKHLQPLLISNVNDLPEEQRQRLETSWAGDILSGVFLSDPRRNICGAICRCAFSAEHADECVGGAGNAESWVWLER